ncbi:hypothetical protein A3L01_06135 [Thermococcus barossii]|uniref:Uncharacterized protein n=2 Tax=Thermococcaceae TaxID=2259 RepID=A0A2Z2MH09_9EURY|nr:hypothetical protein A3L01_06135 [Thermococcus barossii]
MRLVRDLSVLFAVLTSLALVLWVRPEKRADAAFLLAIAFVVLMFLLLAFVREVERLESRVIELESHLKKLEGQRGDGDGLER